MRQEAVKLWDAEEKQREENKGQWQESKWPLCMRLPCRMCSDRADINTFKRMEAYVPYKGTHRYSTAEDFQAVWLACIALGGDLACWPCRRKLGHMSSARLCNQHVAERLIFCDDCCKIKLASEFNKEVQQQWKLSSQSHRISCKICTGEQLTKGRHAVIRPDTALHT